MQTASFQYLHTNPDLGGEVIVPEIPLLLGSEPPLLWMLVMWSATHHALLLRNSGPKQTAASWPAGKSHDAAEQLFFHGESVWGPQQLEQELSRGEWLLFGISGEHLLRLPKTRSALLDSCFQSSI